MNRECLDLFAGGFGAGYGMPWASWASITQAIPPAYTAYLGALAAGEIAAHLTPVGDPA